MGVAFLDFEASSLGKHGYPIEVAWVFTTGESESHLIKPALEWTDWADDAEAIHGISRDQLMREGTSVEAVAQRMIEILTGQNLYATAPSWDGQWLSKLLRAAGLPRHALRLQDTDIAHRNGVLDVLKAANVPEDQREGMIEKALARVRSDDEGQGPPVHRALADAQREQRLWHEARNLAQAMAQGEPRRAAGE